MASELKLSGPLTVEPNTKHWVAFQLMEKIFNHERDSEAKPKSREYWLTLYAQCLKAVNGYDVAEVLQVGKPVETAAG